MDNLPYLFSRLKSRLCALTGKDKSRRENRLFESKTADAGTDLIRLGDEISPVLFGSPIVLCGAVVHGKPNFNTLCDFGVISLSKPNPVVYVSSNAKNFTNIGIIQNKEFSVCFPGAAILNETDFCGVFSGHKTDKSSVFSVQYGMLKNAPLIRECNFCYACRVTNQTKVDTMDVFFGEIIERYADSAYVLDGNPDLDKIKSLAFGPGNSYRVVDTIIGNAWSEYEKLS
jgi:flavin reductase (DIM6/NTAB) family NADH-FMN oxidoreductase RutF